jgi:hypothetical protein
MLLAAEILAMEPSSLVHAAKLFVFVEYLAKLSINNGPLQAAATTLEKTKADKPPKKERCIERKKN